MIKKTHQKLINSIFFQIVIISILFLCINIQKANAQKENKLFTFKLISKVEFKNALKRNYNATFITKLKDSTKLEKAFQSISKTYNKSEKELANDELCSSPRCLTSFKAYFPSLDLYLFYISDYHYEKACFVFASTNKMASGNQRFRGSLGVMSKDGLWVGLEREDCDNVLKIEICKTSKNGVWSFLKYDFKVIDINEEEKTPIFWADKNKIYFATRRYDRQNSKALVEYYSLVLNV